MARGPHVSGVKHNGVLAAGLFILMRVMKVYGQACIVMERLVGRGEGSVYPEICA